MRRPPHAAVLATLSPTLGRGQQTPTPTTLTHAHNTHTHNRDATPYTSCLHASSPPLLHGDDATAAAPLPLFTGVPPPPRARDVGSALSVGSPVWALDWAPQRGGGDGDRTLAVAASPAPRTVTPMAAPTTGPALVQVWRVPRGATPPTLALAIAVDGGVVRAARWRPCADGVSRRSAGILAAALGDATLAVWAVPGDRLDGAIVRVTPLASGHTGGPPSALEWSPRAPHDMLATASFDGSATVWRVEVVVSGGGRPGGATTTALVPLLRTPAHRTPPLRALAFPPPSVSLGHTGVPHMRPLAVAGHGGDPVVWDAARPSTPLASLPAPKAWAFGLAWLAAPLGLLVGHDGGRLTFLSMEGVAGGGSPAACGWSLPKGSPAATAPVWDVASLPGSSVAAYATGAGDVGAFDVLRGVRDRGGGAHPPVTGFRVAAGGGAGAPALRLPSRAALARDAALASRDSASKAAPAPAAGGGRGRGRGKGRGRGAAAAAPPPAPPPPAGSPEAAFVAVHRIAWARIGGRTAVLAAGGGAGVVRVVECDVEEVVGGE